MFVNGHQEALIVFERRRKLLRELPDTVEELGEHWRHLAAVCLTKKRAPVGELVTERQPLLLNENLHRSIACQVHLNEEGFTMRPSRGRSGGGGGADDPYAPEGHLLFGSKGQA